jgi:hypothetical protein
MNFENLTPATEKDPRDTLRNFYRFVSEELPKGVSGHDLSYPVTVGNSDLDAVILGNVGNNKVGIGLFIKDGTFEPKKTIAGTSGKYSRKTLEIGVDGSVQEDSVGIVPDYDLTENEPDFSELSIEQIAVQVVEQIKRFKRPNTN